jgi:iron-sulfur cluster assembly accessory protein
MNMTENAVVEVKKVKEEQGITDDLILSISVIGGGCSGFQYKMAFIPKEKVSEKTHNTYKFNELEVVVDKKSELYLGGTTVDFYQGLEKRGFLFNNPAATGKCGCGSSFSM